jgi:alkylation response protein AidB-like acyl-CoA dehydrogenase
MSTTTNAHELSLPLVPSDEETAIRESVHKICTSFGPRYARDCHEAGRPPEELWRALGDAGFVGINVPEEWGGGGLGMRGLILVGEEMTRAGIGALMLVVSSAIGGSVLALHGSGAQKERWLRGVAAGTTKLAFAITEPDAGTNTHNLRT